MRDAEPNPDRKLATAIIELTEASDDQGAILWFTDREFLQCEHVEAGGNAVWAVALTKGRVSVESRTKESASDVRPLPESEENDAADGMFLACLNCFDAWRNRSTVVRIYRQHFDPAEIRRMLERLAELQ